MGDIKRKPGKPLSPDAEKVRNHLAALSPEALQGMTPKTYRQRTRHVGCTDAVFQMEKMRAKRALGIPKRAMAPRGPNKPKAAPVPIPAPRTGRNFEIIAQVDLANFKEAPAGVLKAFANELLKQFFGETAGFRLLHIVDPPTLEILKPV